MGRAETNALLANLTAFLGDADDWYKQHPGNFTDAVEEKLGLDPGVAGQIRGLGSGVVAIDLGDTSPAEPARMVSDEFRAGPSGGGLRDILSRAKG